jgi:lipopolysaccharide transport system ATP-binding protein
MSSDRAQLASSATSANVTPAVQVEHVSKVYRLYADPRDRLKEMLLGRFGRRFGRDFLALEDVSFNLAPGERLGLIGLNGSGKSTLLQILAGTLAPSAGEIRTTGRIAALLELGSGFNPDYTGRENIYLNASLHGLSQEETDRRFDAIAAFADIGGFLDQPVKTYSSGMFMRVAFAVTTSVDADVLLIDEALAVGDIFFTQKCFRHLHSLIDQGVAIILVSHDMNAVSQFCNSVLLLHHGRTLFHGDPTAGIRTYYAIERTGGLRPAAGSASADATGPSDIAPSDADIPGWPRPDAFLPLDRIESIGSGARCTAIAICDDRGEPARAFEMGQTAVFFFEFVLDEDLDVPMAGVEIINERNVVVHGKNSLQHGALGPEAATRGARVRVRQSMTLSIAVGQYSFALGLATITAADAAIAAELSYQALLPRMRTVLVVANAGTFSVAGRRHGQVLPFHGLCDLEGDSRLVVLHQRESLVLSESRTT